MLLSFLLAVLALRAPADLKPIEPAPPLTLDGVLQAPEGTQTTWEALRGRAVVLEFWATWCGGCVDHIPHLNVLAGRFQHRPVQFISITDEEKAIVSRFLQKHPMAGWIALDSGGKTFRTYGVEGRPRTFLIDAKGVIQAETTPDSVTDGVLEDLLASKPLQLPQPLMTGSPLIGTEPNAPTPLFQVLIRPTAPVHVTGMSPGGERRTGGRWELWGLSLRDLLSRAYDLPSERIETPEWGGQTRYDLSMVRPRGSDESDWALVRQVLDAVFRLQLRREMRETEVYILRKLPGKEPNLQLATTRGHSGPWSREKGELQGMGMQPAWVGVIAQTVLGRPVLDETELRGRYDFELKWNSKDPSSISAAIREQLGLELAPARRSLQYLIVESAKEPKTW